MARRGTFGRIPRAAPDLTNTLVALIREANAQEDQNMVDAWKNGGKVDGKGVDDNRLLAHMKMRRDNLSKDDPNWDEWNNNYIQYDFSINESKMALKNDQGKISDAQMAAFYAKWAKRPDVQQDSEFYRSLLSRAAKWNAAAKGRSAGNGARARAEAHAKWVDGYRKTHVDGAMTAQGYLLFIAKETKAAPANAQGLDDINPTSDGYARFLDIIDDGHSDDPLIQSRIDEMNTEIKKTNPNWKYSRQNLTDLLNRGDAGLAKLIQEATTDTERKGWQKNRTYLTYENARVQQASANERIQKASDIYVAELGHCNGDPYCARNVTKDYRDRLNTEAKSITAGPGGMTMATTDVRTSSALISTISQLDDSLAGKTIKAPDTLAAQAGAGASVATLDYTIFDAAAGNKEPGGFLQETLNGMNADMDRLDKGGWMSTDPVTMSNGEVVLDGHGEPVFQYHIHDSNTPTPPGAIIVPGSTMMTDGTRSVTDPDGTVRPQSVTPPIYVVPVPANLSYVDANGNKIDPKQTGAVELRDGPNPAGPPWVELHGVKGPDGVTRTMYRTGDGSQQNPFLYHEQAPVLTAGENAPVKNAAGQIVVPVKSGFDEKNNPIVVADISGLTTGINASRGTEKSGNFVMGTYSSAGATQASLAVGDLFHRNDPKAAQLADKYIRDLGLGIAGMTWNDPEKVNAMRDMKQLQQRVDLYKAGTADKVLGSAYQDANAIDPKSQAYTDQLARQGFTAQAYGQDEVNRRISLLTSIDDADARLAARPPVRDVRAPLGGGLNSPYWGMGEARPDASAAERAMLQQAKADIFNPTISVSNIKIPGMPNEFAPTATVDMYGRTIYNSGIPAPAPFATASPGTSPNIPKPTGPGLPGPTTPPPPPVPVTTGMVPSVKVPPPPIVTPNGPVYVPPNGYIPASGAGYVPPPPPPPMTDKGGGDKWKNQ